MEKLNDLCEKFFEMLDLSATLDKKTAENDKLCLSKSLEKFLATGYKEDAFTVYFCFSEIFRLFGKGYDNTQKLLELLSDHEYHSGELLSKHRDHYSHSVYVFSLGISIYAHDAKTRKAFLDFYSLPDDGKSTATFLYLWGMTSLFHDIGYPFQLAHEQIKNYTKEVWGDSAKSNPYVSFGNIDAFVAIDDSDRARLNCSLCQKRKFSDLDELFAYGLSARLGYDENKMRSFLRERVVKQPYFLDHGYFGAVTLTKQLFELPDFVLDDKRLDVLTAILLHNNLSKFDMKNSRPVSLSNHPLAYMLMLCDELQNWDRLAYGKISKQDPLAWDIEMNISDNRLDVLYLFDGRYVDDVNGGKRECKSYTEIDCGDYAANIVGGKGKKGFLETSLDLRLYAAEREKAKKSTLYASDNSFINLCDFAKAIHASYTNLCNGNNNADYLNAAFEELPLEFKISNIEQAKSYSEKLELINCFYSSKDLDYPVVESFTDTGYGKKNADNLGFLCREEHVRWVKEKLRMGWRYGTDYATTQERLAKKMHKDLVPNEVLEKAEVDKDRVMIDNIIPLLKRFGHNIRIYSYRSGRKPDLEIAGIGHRFFTDDREKLKKQIKAIIAKYSEDNRVIVRTCFGYGADQLIAECAAEMNVTIKAVLPTTYEHFISVVKADCISNGHKFDESDELRMRHLLAQTVVCKTVRNEENFYLGASRYIIDKCDKVIALWDGKVLPLEKNGEPVNLGGTYHCIEMAKARGLKLDEDIHIVACHRN